MQNALSTLDFEDHTVRMILRDGEPWFVGKDVCKALGHTNSHVLLSRLDEDEKAAVNISYTSANGTVQGREVSIISEPAVYQLVFTSRVDAAKRFKRWLAHEVLPAIRKTGTYSAAKRALTPEQIDLLHRAEKARLEAPAEAFQFDIYLGGRRPDFWSDFEVRHIIIALHRQIRLKEIQALISAAYGPERTPSKSAVARFWVCLDGIKRGMGREPTRIEKRQLFPRYRAA